MKKVVVELANLGKPEYLNLYLPAYMDKLIKKYDYQCGLCRKLEPISCHWLRHSFAIHMLNYGADLSSVQLLLAHGSVDTTMMYLHTAVRWLQKPHLLYHPRG